MVDSLAATPMGLEMETHTSVDAEKVRSVEAKLAIRGLRKSYGSLVALEQTDLDVGAGEFVTLLGPSGSGKTTLLLATAGLNDPDEGEIWIDGNPATYLPPYKRDIGMVFQNYALFPHMTVFENLAFPLRMRRCGAKEIVRAVTGILEVIRLPGIGDRYISQLSGGQQQRVAVARALIYEPSIVLMDEPLGALDKKLREQLQYELRRLHNELGLAMLYVTHDQEEALVMSDRICLMCDGRIEQFGSPEELYFQPTSVFAADFLGESNLLAGQLVEASNGKALVTLDCGRQITGVVTRSMTSGCRVRVMVRPESIRITHKPEGEPALPVRMVDQALTGGTTKCFFQCEEIGTEPLKAQILTGTLANLNISDSVLYLSWDSDCAVVLNDDE